MGKNNHLREAIAKTCLAGLVLWGISVDRGYHWMVGQVAFFLFSVGFQMSNTVLATYLVDSYPLQSISVITYYSVIINLAGFTSPYPIQFFISEWVESTGWTWTYATQCMLVFFVGMPVFALIHRFGPWLRAKSLQPTWVNAEFDTSI
ncbi:unnamed protein product [Penicillium nalgiovense]|nr:unnamed protein product [Penicillium nalgiovense]